MYLEKAEEKFAVLYTVKIYETPIDITRLIEIMTWEKQVIEYFELSEILFELLEDGYICSLKNHCAAIYFPLCQNDKARNLKDLAKQGLFFILWE